MLKRPAALTLALGLALAAGTACGRKGPLELPPGGVPAAVEGLSAVPKDGAVVLTWTNPVKTVAGHPVGALAAVEIWVFEKGLPAAGARLPAAEVERTARLVRRIDVEGIAVASFTYDPGPAGPPSPAFTVRVLDRRGRASDFAPPAVAGPVRPPAAAARPQGEGR